MYRYINELIYWYYDIYRSLPLPSLSLTLCRRRPSPQDAMRASEAFLRKERRDSAQQQQQQRREQSYIYRERSIDDGSHFDPHLDKYPVATSTLRRREQQQQQLKQRDAESSTLKRNKKLGGFEKVKQLFTGGGGSGSHGGSGRSSTSNVSSGKKDSQSSRLTNGNSSTLSRRDKEKEKEREKDKQKERYMVREEEMRSRYREHHAVNEDATAREPKVRKVLQLNGQLMAPKFIEPQLGFASGAA